jgi:hypothetical protein
MTYDISIIRVGYKNCSEMLRWVFDIEIVKKGSDTLI